MSSKQLKRLISRQKRDQYGLTIKGCELVEFQGLNKGMNLVLAGYVKYIELSHLVILWGLVYVSFKAVVMNFPILGGLFQVYRWALRIL
jgi:hypothetical protein